jgi:hypothetical protein
VVSAYSDFRIRGVTFSDARPVGILDLSYDSPTGLYAALSGGVVATRHEGLRALGLTINGGFAKRVRPGLTADIGIVHSRYSHYSGLVSGRSYTEFYAGLAGKVVGARVSLSPNYAGTVRWTLHTELNGHLDLTRGLSADGSVGVLNPIGGGYTGSSRAVWDARLGIAQRFGRISLHGALTTRSRGQEAYIYGRHRRTALIFGISTAL